MAEFLKKLLKSRMLLGGMAVCMLTAFTGSEASAADPYTYTVTIYAGNRGKMVSADDLVVKGGSGNHSVSVTEDKIVVSGLTYGARVNFDAQAGQSVKLLDAAGNTVSGSDPAGGTYMIKGIRESGRDNKGAGLASFEVTEDRDYVVAYGMRGNMVAYTVRYTDAQGREFEGIGPRTYYGNIGDAPIVGYIYIDGYKPQAYNLTKVLTANEADNVFTFVYTPMETGGGGGGGGGNETVTVVVPGQNAGGQTGAETVVQGGAGGAAGAGAGGAAADGGAGGGETEEAPAPEEPQELINLDDEDVPLANVPGEDEDVPLAGRDASRGTFPIIAGVLIAVLAAVLIVIAVILAKKRKEKENEEKKDSAEKMS